MNHNRIYFETDIVSWIITIMLFALLLFASGCGRNNQQNDKTMPSGELIIFHAGSLSVPFKEVADSFGKQYPDVNIKREAAGSVSCARKITDLGRKCDIMASADYKVIDKLLFPDHTDWLIKFATNEMVLVYTENSKYREEINKNNWHQILQKKDVLFGRSDPDSDPCGYRTVLSLRLSEKYYNRPGMAREILNKDKRYMRPKGTDLLALLESNTLDYIFLYRSVAEQHELPYITLPDSVNLGNAELKEWYNSASVDIAGKKPGEKMSMRGEPMIYGITMINEAPNPKAAKAFFHFLLSREKGMKIMERNGQESLIPASHENYNAIPAEFKDYAKP